MNTTYPQPSTRKCPDCGGKTLLVSQSEEDNGGHGTIITSVYRCADDACQKEADKRMAKQAKLQVDQEKAKKRRLENIQENRKKTALEKNKNK
ncbi:MAG: hypothetical protein ACEQSA_06040 [Weeksellaceae bacterium]